MSKLNIYLRKDGRYEGRISCGKNEEGKRTFRYVLARTKEQVIGRMNEILNGQPYIECSKTVSELFSEWHHSILHRVKESTAANYTMKANRHILPMFGDKQAELLAQGDVVFPEARLLIELLLNKPLAYLHDSVWANNNRYYVNGKIFTITSKHYKKYPADVIIAKLEEYRQKNSYDDFNQYIYKSLYS